MSTSWTLAAVDICSNGLGHLGVAEAGQTPSAEDMQAALGALDAILKELPLYGYSWPKLSNEASVAWTAGQTINLPADYYGYLRVWADGVPLQYLKTTDWNDLQNRSQTGPHPTHFYVSPDNVLYLYPVPEADPVLTIQYQRLIQDASLTTTVDLPQYMLNTLGYGVAAELLIQYSIPEPKASRIEKRWMEKRNLALSNAVSGEAISFGVADDREWDPTNWQAPAPIPDGFDAGSL